MDFDCWCLEAYRQEQKRYTEAENTQQWRYSRRYISKAFLRKVAQKFGTIAFRKKNVSNRGHSKRYKKNEYYLQEIQVFPNNLLL